MNFIISVFKTVELIWVLDVALSAVVIYYIFLEMAKSRAFPVLIGMGIILLLAILISYLKLEILSFLLSRIIEVLIIAFVVLFPSEIKRSLFDLGQRFFLLDSNVVETSSIEILMQTIGMLKKRCLGAIIVLRRVEGLATLLSTGTILRANLNSSLLVSIFHKESPLHDGAVIISSNLQEIIAAGCYIDSISNEAELEGLGSRHRAGVGLSESTDAVIIIISEERQTICLAYKGVLHTQLSIKDLTQKIQKIIQSGKSL